MKESISLEAYITLTLCYLGLLQMILLTVSSVTGIETLQHKKVHNLLNSVKENGCDLEHLVIYQVLLSRNTTLKSVNKTA